MNNQTFLPCMQGQSTVDRIGSDIPWPRNHSRTTGADFLEKLTMPLKLDFF
jgi:hypothetical protein